GRPQWLIVKKAVLRRADGSVLGIVGTNTDITERRRQEEALRDQAKLTRDIIDANPNPLFVKDTQARHVHVNAAWARISGVSAEEAIGRTIQELIPGLEDQYSKDDDALISRRADMVTREATRPGKLGARTFIMNKSALLKADGSVRGLVGTM